MTREGNSMTRRAIEPHDKNGKTLLSVPFLSRRDVITWRLDDTFVLVLRRHNVTSLRHVFSDTRKGYPYGIIGPLRLPQEGSEGVCLDVCCSRSRQSPPPWGS